MNTKFQQI